MKARFWGTRGSIATPGSGTVKYGGNTSCVEVVSDAGTLIVLDCGTGARLLGNHLVKSVARPARGHLLLTHTHWDHIQGFPFFAPAFAAGFEWVIYGPADGVHHLEQALAGQMQYMYFPVELNQVGATLNFHNLGEGDFHFGDVRVRARYLNHPAVTLGYRLEVGGRSLVYCTDHEPFSPKLFRGNEAPGLDAIVHAGDRGHVEFLRGSDLVIHDAQYTSKEYDAKRNWGHSTMEYVVQVSALAGVKQVVMFHHDPSHDDTQLEAMENQTRQYASGVDRAMKVSFAQEGAEIDLAETGPDQRTEEAPFSPSAPQSVRVLVADDDAEVRVLVSQVLEAEGYSLVGATDGDETVAKVLQELPDLVLLDARLPGMNGFDVLDRIRAHGPTHDLPVIMLTSATDENLAVRGFNAGATDYMTKPLSPSQVRARVSGWLRRSTAGPGPAQ